MTTTDTINDTPRTFPKGSAHSFSKGNSLTSHERERKERKERTMRECAIVRRACDAFFEGRGIEIGKNEPPPFWDHDLIESCFELAALITFNEAD